MVKVSTQFKNKIYADERTVKARVSFELLDAKSYEDAVTTVSEEAEISRSSQIINGSREMTRKFATFERDYFALDGSSFIPPPTTDTTSEIGWWTDSLSGENGILTTSPYLEFNFSEAHSSIGLTLTFDTWAKEYPTDFLIEVFDVNNALIASETVTNNSSHIYYFERGLENYRRIRVTFTKMLRSSRRLRVTEVDFGVVREYTNEEIVSLKVLEEMDLLTSTVPSNELEIVLDNSDRAFSILNSNGVYKFLKTNQEMSASIGLLIDEATDEYEYIPMGKFFLNEWKTEEGAMTATFVGRDIFSILENIEYTTSLRNVTLYNLAVDILTKAGITSYEIDESLKDVTTTGFIEPIRAREALQMIAIAGRSVVRAGRDGKIIFEVLEELTYESGYVNFVGQDGLYAGTTTPQIDIDYALQQIDLDNVYDIPKVTLAPPISHLIFKIYNGAETELSVKYLNPKQSEGQGFEINNPLINTEAHAASVAEWEFREYNLVADYEANWRQNPALECGYIILIEDSYESKRKARITRQEFNYAGYLDGVTEAKGGV